MSEYYYTLTDLLKPFPAFTNPLAKQILRNHKYTGCKNESSACRKRIKWLKKMKNLDRAHPHCFIPFQTFVGFSNMSVRSLCEALLSLFDNIKALLKQQFKACAERAGDNIEGLMLTCDKFQCQHACTSMLDFLDRLPECALFGPR